MFFWITIVIVLGLSGGVFAWGSRGITGRYRTQHERPEDFPKVPPS